MQAYDKAMDKFPGLLDICEHDKERQDCPKCRKPSTAEMALQRQAAASRDERREALEKALEEA